MSPDARTKADRGSCASRTAAFTLPVAKEERMSANHGRYGRCIYGAFKVHFDRISPAISPLECLCVPRNSGGSSRSP
jgi:hypothetical protein